MVTKNELLQQVYMLEGQFDAGVQSAIDLVDEVIDEIQNWNIDMVDIAELTPKESELLDKIKELYWIIKFEDDDE